MTSKKHLPLAFYSALVLSIGAFKPYSAVAQTTAVSASVATEEKMYRPNFHFTPKKGWMNDPNGMFYANGYYHFIKSLLIACPQCIGPQTFFSG